MTMDALKTRVRDICQNYKVREQRARRMFIEEKAASLHFQREREFSIRRDIAEFYKVPHSAVSFAGSAQLGFSAHKNKLFEPAISDLDAACISADLFQLAWIDVVSTSHGFTRLSSFGSTPLSRIELFKQQILRRGMIRIDAMPISALSRSWSDFQDAISARHTAVFSKITMAIYMNEYAFCWKQDSALTDILR